MTGWQLALVIGAAVAFGMVLGWEWRDKAQQRDDLALMDRAVTEHEASLREAEISYLQGLALDAIERGDEMFDHWPLTAPLTHEEVMEVSRHKALDVEWVRFAAEWGAEA